MSEPKAPPNGGGRPEPFSAERSERNGTLVLALRGELDLSSVDRLSEAAADVPPGANVVIDLAALEFMDSAGLRTLMNLDVRAREEGWALALARPQQSVLRLLELSSLEGRIPIRDMPD